MLTKDEEDFLKKIPLSKKVTIKPFDPDAKRTGESVVQEIKKSLPNVDVLFMGSIQLEVSGQNDIDIYVLTESKDFNDYLPALKKLLGKPKNIHKTFIEWNFTKKGFDVEVYLTEPPERQIKIFEILKSDNRLLIEYEKLKLKFDGKSYKDYQKAKYEFYNRILITDAIAYLDNEVNVIIDRHLGSKHPNHKYYYKVNYGYVPNTLSPDGEELDVYYLGTDMPINKAKGTCIAIIHRTNDDDDKLIVLPKGMELSDEEIEKQIRFQEQWFEHKIIRK